MEIAGEMELFLSDFCYHKNEGKYRIRQEVDEAIRRWVYLLPSGWEWSPGRKDSTRFGLLGICDLLRSDFRIKSGNLYWPLAGPQEWLAWKSRSVEPRTDSGD